jgi:hypothetical protein
MSISRGYKTVSDCKKILFLLLDKLNEEHWEQELKELYEQEEEEHVYVVASVNVQLLINTNRCPH